MILRRNRGRSVPSPRAAHRAVYDEVMGYAGKALLVVAILLSGSGDVRGARGILVIYDTEYDLDYDGPSTLYFDFDTSANGDTTRAKKIRD